MPRALRYVPPGSLVEVTTTTVHRRFLLTPGPELNRIAVGILARAARKYRMPVCAFRVLSNHAHYLVLPDDARHLARFMGYLNANLAKEVGRLRRWRDKIWGRRYQGIVVDNDPVLQERRLRYLLANGVKENLVRTPEDWPGPDCADSLLTGRAATGVWFDRTKEYQARQRGESFDKYDYAEDETLELTPIPAWKHLSAEARHVRAAELVREITHEARQKREATEATVLGVRRILRQDPHAAPNRPAKSPAPRFHARTREARRRLEHAYLEFKFAFRRAADDLKQAKRARFPFGSFPPGLPFVPYPSS